MPCTSVHNVLNDSHFCAQVELEEPVGAEDHRGKRMTCTNVHNVLNDSHLPDQVVLFALEGGPVGS